MKTKLHNLWYRIQSNFWLVPCVLALSSVACALGLVWLDYLIVDEGGHPLKDHWFLVVSPDGAQAFLGTTAGSMLGVAGVVFSITILSLTVASGQFGPRLLREFMKDLGNQVVLGTFIACFLYCLIVLRYVNFGGTLKEGAVPYIAINFALLVAIAGLAVLIYFIHHVATAIQADTIVARLSEKLRINIHRLFPKPNEETRNKSQKEEMHLPEGFELGANLIRCRNSGYIQAIDYDGLLAKCNEKELVLKLHQRAGKFLVQGSAIMSYVSTSRLSDEEEGNLLECIVLGNQPTAEQDIEFSMNQIVEIAVRSLSPGINDPFTAIRCIDVLSEAVRDIAERGLSEPYCCNDAGMMRIAYDPITFPGILDTAFSQIRQNTRSSVAVRIRLLEALARIGIQVSEADAKSAIMKHAQMIKDGARADGVSEIHDLKDIEERFELISRVLNQT